MGWERNGLLWYISYKWGSWILVYLLSNSLVGEIMGLANPTWQTELCHLGGGMTWVKVVFSYNFQCILFFFFLLQCFCVFFFFFSKLVLLQVLSCLWVTVQDSVLRASWTMADWLGPLDMAHSIRILDEVLYTYYLMHRWARLFSCSLMYGARPHISHKCTFICGWNKLLLLMGGNTMRNVLFSPIGDITCPGMILSSENKRVSQSSPILPSWSLWPEEFVSLVEMTAMN